MLTILQQTKFSYIKQFAVYNNIQYLLILIFPQADIEHKNPVLVISNISQKGFYGLALAILLTPPPIFAEDPESTISLITESLIFSFKNKPRAEFSTLCIIFADNPNFSFKIKYLCKNHQVHNY